MADPKIIIRIAGDSKKFRKELDKIERESDKTIRELNRDGKKLTKKTSEESKKRIAISKRESQARIRNAKRVAAVLAVLAVVGISKSIVAFAVFEQGLAGVSKTTNIVGEDLKDLGEEITDFSIKLGTSTSELLGLAKSAGQLGVKGSKNIIKFTKVMAGLAKTTNIVGEEGAIALARLIKVTDENIDNVDRLGSVIVDLGNNTAALENEILFTAQQIAGAGKVFGITATQALGLGAAFAELAIPPELARGTILRAFGKIQKAISEAGADMEKLILITGLTGEELEKTFAEDSVKVFGLFLKGVARLPKSQLIPFLKDFELAGLRLEATLPKLALGSNLVAEKVERAAIAFDENTASADELAIQLDTTLARFKQLKEELEKTKREIGEEFIPTVEKQITILKTLAPFISDTLVPIIQFLTDGIVETAKQFDLLTKSVRRFLGIPVETKFEEMRDLVKEEAGLQTGMKGIINKFKTIIELSEKVVSPEIIAPDEPETTIFGEVLDPESAAKVQAINDEIAVLMAIAREDEKNERLRVAEELEEERQEEAERLATAMSEKLGIDLQEITDKEERDKQAAKDKKTAQDKADADALKARKKAEKDLIKLKKNRVDEEKKLDKAISDSAFQTLSTIVGDSKAAQLALLLVQKALAVSRIIVESRVAAELAFGSQLVHGDPTSFARATAAKAAVLAAGAASAGIVAATAIPEIAGTLKAQEGGIVPGGFGGGDKVPFLLEPGELIVPQNLNPLSPNFDDTFGGGEGGGGQEVVVKIELTDEASQFITVGQREDTTLGVQR